MNPVPVALPAIILLHAITPPVQQAAPGSAMILQRPPRVVPDTVMRQIHDEVRTPFKRGVVLRGDDGRSLDCPSVFRHNGTWHMMYVVFDDRGYETWLATSPDLLAWTVKGRVLSFREGTWDQHQAAGYVALQDTAWGGTHGLQTHDGAYWMTYLGGALEGYETDPLSIGVASTSDPAKAVPWDRHPKPVMTPSDPGARPFEAVTLYKSHVIRDPEARLGAPFVMWYNGKDATGTERIGMAVSDDMTRWRRHGDGPVIDNASGISGDPQVVRIGDVWVMFYFGAFWKPKAFDTFACSYDLEHWTKWEGPHLVEPSEPWDETFAHKPWVIKHNGVVYHFYCAVGSEGRVIALATSKDLKE
jgi:predicted GH43/DUF377 family glycosyl hydrolase